MEDPKNLIVGAANLIFNGQSLGFTEDATVIGSIQDKLEIANIQQVIGKVKIIRLSASFTIKCTLAETTLEIIKTALGINAEVGKNDLKRTLELNQAGDLPEGVLEILCKGPDDVDRTWHFYKCVLKETGDVNIDSRNFSKISVTFETIYDSAHSTSSGYIEEDYVPTGA